MKWRPQAVLTSLVVDEDAETAEGRDLGRDTARRPGMPSSCSLGGNGWSARSCLTASGVPSTRGSVHCEMNAPPPPNRKADRSRLEGRPERLWGECGRLRGGALTTPLSSSGGPGRPPRRSTSGRCSPSSGRSSRGPPRSPDLPTRAPPAASPRKRREVRNARVRAGIKQGISSHNRLTKRRMLLGD